MTAELVWPSGSDYAAAVQQPTTAFRRADLRHGTMREGLFGLPASASGQTSIVFTADIEDSPLAIRCFTKSPHSGKERFQALSDRLATKPNPAFVDAAWVDEGVFVNEQWWPLVIMPWVDGDTLNVAVEDRLTEPAELRRIADRFLATVRSLEADRLAHGDLQHGNILVLDDCSIRLVDYDAVWIGDRPLDHPNEVGQPNFQHPERLRTAAWGPTVDSFSALVIHVSLAALATEPALWEKYHTGENLIFTAADFERPQASELFAHLRRLDDPEVRQLTDRLDAAARSPLASIIGIDGLLDGSSVLGTSVVSATAPSPTGGGGAGAWWNDPLARLADDAPGGVQATWSEETDEGPATDSNDPDTDEAVPATSEDEQKIDRSPATLYLLMGLTALVAAVAVIVFLISATSGS